ncbi:MAG: lipid-A-disaccharide synthase N-terminal domain-containing protein [Chlamydiia bacterium]|nr:lipid-A-disaccharide synthase N-terminal domain-containing protein [Chlamydiia bacterium]
MDAAALRMALYPLGFVASLAFTLRFIVQWVRSERRQKSVINRSFWRFSFMGNVLMWLHGLIQFQFHICLIQAFNGITSWRNLQLMDRNRPQPALQRTLLLFPLAALLVGGLFAFQAALCSDIGEQWLRSPRLPWQASAGAVLPWYWHVLGCVGMGLFALRFWLQWWEAERCQRSELGQLFWWLSLVGGTLSCLYFIPQNDLVNVLGYGTGLIPNIRNLMLIAKEKRWSQAQL